MRAPRILIFTGEGKGKTTAALGMVLRAAGHGMRCCVMQFIKSVASGELAALASLPRVKIFQMGQGFVPPPNTPAFARHKIAAEHALEQAEQIIFSGEFDVIVLDEICIAVARGLLTKERVIHAVRQAREGTVIALTGRYACEELIAIADTVTEMRCVKHGLGYGYSAQKGVEM